MATYRAHALKLHTTGTSAVVLRDIISQALQIDPEVRAEVTAENTSPDHVAQVARKLVHNWATYDLVQFLDNVGVTGLCITADETHPGVVGYLQKCDDCGVPASGSVHRSLTYTLGLVVPRRLSCDNRGDARIDFDLIILGDGSADPVTIADNVALPSITASPARFTLGPVKLKNVAFMEYSSLEIDFGNNVTTRGVESDIDDTHIEEKTHAPKITLTGIDPAWFSASKIPIGGAVVANSTDYIYLRKRSTAASGFVGDATAEHIKFTLAGFASVTQALRAEMTRVSETQIVITGAKDASGNMPIIVDTTAALP